MSCPTVSEPLSLVFVTCGDGNRDGGEFWDDGNKINGDGCSEYWVIETGYSWTGGSSVTADTCHDTWGDGVFYGSEAGRWDDGNFDNGDGWSAGWIIEAGWICSGGSTSTPHIWADTWGDGLVVNRATPNYCDDGNSISGDGCSSSWAIESGWTWSGGSNLIPDVCQDICGDGSFHGSVVGKWDDGNLVSGDGCDSSCNIESGWSWTIPSGHTAHSCTTVWGDGIKMSNEGWDDGNTVSDDGCSSICILETGFDWVTDAAQTPDTICSTIWGDGFKKASEAWDDGNNINGDGWSSAWAVESGWFCSGGVQSNPDIWIDIWGDGIVMAQAPTYCDDGNNIDGDGWSLTWTVEDGWTCTPGDSTSKSIWEKMISKNSIFSELMKELSSKPYISTAGIISALISSLITLSSPNNVWQIGNLLQMFMLLLLLNIYIPEKVIIFITTNLFALLSFDIPFLKEIRDYLLGDIVIFFESEQKDEKLKLLEAKSGSTPINASNSVLVLLWVIVIHAAIFQGFYTLAIWIIRPFKAAKNNLFEIINEVVYFTVIFWLIVVGDKSMWTGWVTDAYIFILMSPGFFMLILILGKVSWVNN
jgi:cysteine-rich repeat protein